MNKINIPVYSCCVSALVSSSRFSNQSAFVTKQSNGATALADSACSNTIVNNPNLTTRNTPPAMSISIKQANGDLIPVTMQGDLEIHPNLPPLQDVSVVPKCEMNLLSVAHMRNLGCFCCFGFRPNSCDGKNQKEEKGKEEKEE